MASSCAYLETLITCNNITVSTRRMNEQTTIEQLRKYVSESFHARLPESYRLVYYDTMKMSMVDLEDQLRHGLNPFQINPSMGVQDIASTPISLHLFVVNHSSMHASVQLQTVEQYTYHSNDESSFSDDTHSESYSSVNSVATNCDVSQDDGEHISRTNEEFKTMNILSNRLSFSLDVKPMQRDIYRSDQFSIGSDKPNGRIARIQGIKESHQKMLQVLPRLRIPVMYYQPNVTLCVVVVSEEVKNGMRIWYKHSHKGFLPENYTEDTEKINPIEFDLNPNNCNKDEDYTLHLQMITKWNKSSKELEAFYQLEEEKTIRVHPALHDPYSPRLICVLRRSGRIDWETFCLSDFIRSPKCAKQAYSTLTTGRIRSPHNKRVKNHD